MRLAVLLLAAASVSAGADWIDALDGRVERAPGGAVTALSLRRGWVSDSDLDLIARMDRLERLDLSETRVTDLGLLKLKELKNVRELNLFYAELVTDEGLAVMRNWTKIERINARGTKVTDNTLALLAGKTTISSLDIGYAEVTDSGLQHLATLPNLRELTFGGNKLTEVGLQVLRALPQIQSLNLSGKQRTDSGLWTVGTTDIGLDPVAAVTELRSLNLSGLGISGRGLAKLKPLAKLERLDVHGCKRVGDEAVEALAAMSSLQWVDVRDTAFTAAGTADLKRRRPELRVVGAPAAE